MLKYEKYCLYIGGGYARPLGSLSDVSTMQYIQKAFFCKTFLYTEKEKEIKYFYVRCIFFIPKDRELY